MSGLVLVLVKADRTADYEAVITALKTAIAVAPEAERRIAEAKTRAMGSVSEIAGETARTIVSQLIGQDVTAAEAAQALGTTGRG